MASKKSMNFSIPQVWYVSIEALRNWTANPDSCLLTLHPDPSEVVALSQDDFEILRITFDDAYPHIERGTVVTTSIFKESK